VSDSRKETEMRTRQFVVTVLGLFLIALGAMWQFGCEYQDLKQEEPEDEIDRYFQQNAPRSQSRQHANSEDLVISPQSASVTFIGQEILFTITGGKTPFHWHVGDTADGSIDKQDNQRQAVYTAKTLEPNTVLANDRDGKTALAGVGQVVAPLSMQPASLTIPHAVANTYTFIAIGGSAPYNWQHVISSLGTVAGDGGDNETATYTVTGAGGIGTNLIVLIDQAGSSVSAWVAHE